MACPFTPSPHGLCFTPSAVWSYTDSNIQVPTISSLSDFCCWAKLGKPKLIANPTRATIKRIFIVSSRGLGWFVVEGPAAGFLVSEGARGSTEACKLHAFSCLASMKKIAMCADSGWGDLLVNRYRKRRV